MVATAQDAASHTGRAQATVVARDATQDTTPPVVPLVPPTADTPFTAPTMVRWTLALSPQGEARFTAIATGTTAPRTACSAPSTRRSSSTTSTTCA